MDNISLKKLGDVLERERAPEGGDGIVACVVQSKNSDKCFPSLNLELCMDFADPLIKRWSVSFFSNLPYDLLWSTGHWPK